MVRSPRTSICVKARLWGTSLEEASTTMPRSFELFLRPLTTLIAA
jgi:hypothetical protein